MTSPAETGGTAFGRWVPLIHGWVTFGNRPTHAPNSAVPGVS